MNIKLNEFKINAPQAKIVVSKRNAIINSDKFILGSGISTFEITDSIARAKFGSVNDLLYFYVKKNSSQKEQRFVICKLNASSSGIGIYTSKFSDNFSSIDAGVIIYNINSAEYSTAEWYPDISSSGDIFFYGKPNDYSVPNEQFLYNHMAFSKYHYSYTNTEYLKTNFAVSIDTIRKLNFGNVFNTGITINDSLIIFNFFNGTRPMYITNSSALPAVEKQTNGTYKFTYTSLRLCADLKLLLNKYVYDGSEISISNLENQIVYGITGDAIVLTSYDIYDTQNNLIFRKNIDVEKYMKGE